ncbi:flagellar protein FliT [uncultured Ralstonia sp.]|jgi:flagellar protein FliT|uniref:flagellar protein FliT n=1 Tax=Ralstonia sp. TaxID=54061 RepID=UPI001EA6A49E|nr:flagellar protein FliT [uncultured Ralstonia sp.]UCF24525.1 MAG: flagellar protein FliT [Ralstonia sp.]
MSWTLATTRPSRQIEPIRPADDSGSLFACYEAIACLSEQMVDAAEAGDWDGVSALERECAVYMERLGQAGARAALSREELQRKRDLMMRILANDARVRALVCPRQDQLMHLVSGARRSIGARQAYAAVSYY